MQNKRLFFAVTGILISFLFTVNVNAETLLITSDHVNIRSGPGIEYETIGQGHSSEEFLVNNTQDDWIEIELGDGTGWIIRDYVSLQGDSGEINENITIQHNQTQIRSGPSTDYEIKTFVNQGDKFDVTSETDEWYKVTNGDITGFVFKELTIDKTTPGSFNFKNKTIVIDAGHGGHDVGAIGATETYEKNFTYSTAKELEKTLSSLGANVLLTRPDDEFISLKSRTSYTNAINADAFISIHYNSFPEKPEVTGIETYYYHDLDKELAELIQKEIILQTSSKDRESSFGNYYVIRESFKPAVLVELGFISNEEMEQQLLTNTYQKQLVTGIVSGLARYFYKVKLQAVGDLLPVNLLR